MPAGASVYKILLVDDDPDFVDATKIILESRQEYKVVSASNGAFGLAVARAERPDLILLDVIMPFEDGFDLARELKADPELAEIPIMMLTSFSQRKSETDIPVARGMELEAEDYLEKTIGPGELLHRIDRLLKEK
jgi:DNA-binding response OmpR family regulator